MRAGARRVGTGGGRRTVVVAALMAACPLGTACGPDLGRFEYREPHMGTEVRLVLLAPDRAAADSAAAAAFRTVGRLDSLFSDYRPDSGVAVLAQAAGDGVPVPVALELWEVLSQGREWADRTGGAFDVTVGPLTRLWRSAMRRGVLPDPARLEEARAASGYTALVLAGEEKSVLLERPGMSLDLGGIAKGYVAQTVLEELQARGISAVLVDAGGDLALGDAPPREAGWRVEFPGGEVHRMANLAVATSGDRYQYLESGGVRYSHILDPRTGVGVTASPTVVVVASDATTADVLASALTVLAPEAGRSLVAALDGVAVRVRFPAGETGSWETDGFPTPRPRPTQETNR